MINHCLNDNNIVKLLCKIGVIILKVAFWTLGIFVLGLFGIVMVNLFGNIAVTDQLNYTTMKNAVQAAMYDSLDMAHYRVGFCLCTDSKKQSGKWVFKDDSEYELLDITYDDGKETCVSKKKTCEILKGEYRLNKKTFSESLIRRFAEMVNNNKDYEVTIQDIIEYPPKVSVRINSKDKQFIPTDDRGDEDDYVIVNQMDAIIETKKDIYATPSPTSAPEYNCYRKSNGANADPPYTFEWKIKKTYEGWEHVSTANADTKADCRQACFKLDSTYSWGYPAKHLSSDGWKEQTKITKKGDCHAVVYNCYRKSNGANADPPYTFAWKIKDTYDGWEQVPVANAGTKADCRQACFRKDDTYSWGYPAKHLINDGWAEQAKVTKKGDCHAQYYCYRLDDENADPPVFEWKIKKTYDGWLQVPKANAGTKEDCRQACFKKADTYSWGYPAKHLKTDGWEEQKTITKNIDCNITSSQSGSQCKWHYKNDFIKCYDYRTETMDYSTCNGPAKGRCVGNQTAYTCSCSYTSYPLINNVRMESAKGSYASKNSAIDACKKSAGNTCSINYDGLNDTRCTAVQTWTCKSKDGKQEMNYDTEGIKPDCTGDLGQGCSCKCLG